MRSLATGVDAVDRMREHSHTTAVSSPFVRRAAPRATDAHPRFDGDFATPISKPFTNSLENLRSYTPWQNSLASLPPRAFLLVVKAEEVMTAGLAFKHRSYQAVHAGAVQELGWCRSKSHQLASAPGGVVDWQALGRPALPRQLVSLSRMALCVAALEQPTATVALLRQRRNRIGGKRWRMQPANGSRRSVATRAHLPDVVSSALHPNE